MQEFLASLSETSSIDIVAVIVNVLLAAALSQVIYMVFVRFGNTFSNRKQFGKIFFMITVSTTLIISIIQASLALSLGLVGALSIVRFRTAIKEAEELAYTFFAITIGLGFGANARVLTIVCGALILLFVIIRGLYFKDSTNADTYNFSVISKTISLENLTEIIEKYTVTFALRRSDLSHSTINAQYIVEFKDLALLEKLNATLKNEDPEIVTSFISNSTFM